jgi:pyruvate,orthophosphate dikinase
MKKYVYLFGNGKAEGRGNMKDLLGGKGAGLAEMTRIGVPVPPGFTISTDACTEFYKHKRHIPENILKEIEISLSKLERLIGKKLGDPGNPLLVSVRSGAKFSMPGMMDTILNLGLNDEIAECLSTKTDNPVFVWDAYRRLIEMFSDVVFGIDKEEFEHIFAEIRNKEGVKSDSDLTPEILKEVIKKSKQLVKNKAKTEFPQRRVYLDAFDIDTFEVTTVQFLRFVRATDRPPLLDWRYDGGNFQEAFVKGTQPPTEMLIPEERVGVGQTDTRLLELF